MVRTTTASAGYSRWSRTMSARALCKTLVAQVTGERHGRNILG